jgi:hypothetical protein
VKRDGSARSCRWTAATTGVQQHGDRANWHDLGWQAAGLDLALIGLAAVSEQRSPQVVVEAVPLPLAVVCLMPIVYRVDLPSPIR